MTDHEPTIRSTFDPDYAVIPVGLHLELLCNEITDTVAEVRAAVAGRPQGTTLLTAMADGLEQSAARLHTAWRELYPGMPAARPTTATFDQARTREAGMPWIVGSIPNEGKMFLAPLKAVSFELKGSMTPRGAQVIEQTCARAADPEPEPLPDAEGLAAARLDHAFVMRPGGPVEDGCWHFESGRKCMARKDDHPAADFCPPVGSIPNAGKTYPARPGPGLVSIHPGDPLVPVTGFNIELEGELPSEVEEARAAGAAMARLVRERAQARQAERDAAADDEPPLPDTEAIRMVRVAGPRGVIRYLGPEDKPRPTPDARTAQVMADLKLSLERVQQARARHLRAWTPVVVSAPPLQGLRGRVRSAGPDVSGLVLVEVELNGTPVVVGVHRDAVTPVEARPPVGPTAVVTDADRRPMGLAPAGETTIYFGDPSRIEGSARLRRSAP